jgi:hypothetical protein
MVPQEKHLCNITPAETFKLWYHKKNICTTSHQQRHLSYGTTRKTSVQHHTSKDIYTTVKNMDVTLAKTSVQHHTSKNICTTSHQQKHLYITLEKNIGTTSHQ